MAKKKKNQDTSPLAMGRKQQGSTANKRAEKTGSNGGSQSSSSSKTVSRVNERASRSTFMGGSSSTSRTSGSSSSGRSTSGSSSSNRMTTQDRINQRSYGTTNPNLTTRRQMPATSKELREQNTQRNNNLKQTQAQTARDRLEEDRLARKAESEKRRGIDTAFKSGANTTSNIAAATSQQMMAQRKKEEEKRRTDRVDTFLNEKQKQKEAAKSRQKATLDKVDSALMGIADRETKWENEKLAARNAELKEKKDNEYKKASESALERFSNDRYDKQENSEFENKMLDYTKGVVERKALGYGKTGSKLLKLNEGYQASGRWAQEDPEYARHITSSDFAARADKAFEDYSTKQDEVQKKLTAAEKNTNGVGRTALQAYGSGIEMAIDRAAGPLWAASMFASTYGNLRGQAMKEGATDEEDARAAFLGAALEVGTEYMFKPVAGIANKFGGKHSLDFAGKLARRVSGKLTGGYAKAADIAIRTIGSQFEEGTEEFASWLLSPYINNAVYKNALQERKTDAAHSDYDDFATSFWSQFESEDQAQEAAVYVNSDEFVDGLAETYEESGATKKEARSMAKLMQEYFLAYFDDDEKAVAKAEEKMDKFVVGDVREKHSWGELRDTLASTFLLTGVTGGIGTFSTYQMGKAILNEPGGKDKVKQYTDIVINYDPNNDNAKTLKHTLDAGNEPTGTQVYEVMAQADEALRDLNNMETAGDRTKQRKMQEEDLHVDPIQVTARGVSYGEKTAEAYEASKDRTMGLIRGIRKHGVDIGLSEEALTDEELMNTAADAVASYETGTITAEQINEIVSDDAVRSIFEQATGIDLSQYDVMSKKGGIDTAATNKAVMSGLLANAADNYVQMARAEQKQWDNRTRGVVHRAVTQNSSLGEAGGLAMHDVLKAADPRDDTKYLATARVASNIYDYARRTDISWDKMKKAYKGRFKAIDIDSMKGVYDAAKEDKAAAETPYLGHVVNIGEAMRFEKGDKGMTRVTGQFINDSNRELTGEEDEALRTLATELGINIRIIPDADVEETMGEFGIKDSIDSETFNGFYDRKTGTIILAETNSLDDNIRYAVSHETTHHLAMYAPEAYMALSNYVMDKWFKNDPASYNAAIKSRQELYKLKANQDLSEEEALEEIIADATKDFWADPEFVEQLSASTKEPGVIKQFLNAVRDIIRGIRNMLASGRFDGTDHEHVLWDILGTYTKAEKLWLAAYREAVRNKAAVGLVDWQERANAESDTRHSLTDTHDYIINRKDSSARWTDDRIDSLIKEYGASNPDYSQAYAVLMNPRDFLKLTLADVKLDKWNRYANEEEPAEIRGLSYDEATSYKESNPRNGYGFDAFTESVHALDEEELRNNEQTPFLTIQSKSGMEVQGHEGRHRMRALMERGIKSVPVVIKDADTKYTKVPTESMTLTAQDFGYDPVNNNASITIKDLVPIKESNRDELLQKFGGEAEVRFSVSDTDYMKAVEAGDMEEAQRMVDEAAEAAGYTETVYHGTYNFGTTKFDDEYGLYTTSEVGTAGQFAGGGNLRSIAGEVNPDTATPKQLIDHINKNSGWNIDRIATKEDFENEIERITYSEEDIKKYNLSKEWVDRNKENVKALEELYDRMKDGETFFYSKFNSPGHTYGANASISTRDEVVNLAKSYVGGKEGRGVYALALRPENMVTIKGDGAYYASIDIPKELQKYATAEEKERGFASTDQLVRMAHKAGYSTIKFEDIVEGGDFGNAGHSDVFVSMNPSRNVKSLDPVTYNDAGNVIPLSERFNAENNDIRFSIPEYTQEEMDAHRQYLIDSSAESYEDPYTDDLNESGFIFPDGKLPRMGEYGARADDHNLVIGAYDDIGYDTSQHPKADAMARFLNEGNIRYMPENGSIELGTEIEPTYEQYERIREMDYVNMIEFTAPDGHTADYKEYDGDRSGVVSDIKRFYRDGEIGGSELAQFRYSLSESIGEDEPLGVETESSKGNSIDVRYSIPTEINVHIKGDGRLTSVRLMRDGFMKGRKKEREAVNAFIDMLGDHMTAAADLFTYVSLSDVQTATVTYRRDADGNPTSVIMSCQVQNGEYEINYDFSTICKKRKAFQDVIEQLFKRTDIDTLDLTEENIFEINKALESYGFEIACPICFVEARRYANKEYADKIISTWNAEVEKVNPNAEYFDFANADTSKYDYEAIDAALKSAKMTDKMDFADKCRVLVNSGEVFQKKMQQSDILTNQGVAGMKAMSNENNSLFGYMKQSRGASAPKEIVSFNAYNGEIEALKDTYKDMPLADFLYTIGGARLQSFSDFQIENVYDYIQLIAGMASRKLPAHAYTKEVAFAKLFGMTGMKINLSLVCDVDPNVDKEHAGLKKDKDGKWVYNLGSQSFKLEDARELQSDPRYAKNVGTIMVGMSDEHIIMALNDSDVRFVIPYHKSGLPGVIQDSTHLDMAKDYTAYQNTCELSAKGIKKLQKAGKETSIKAVYEANGKDVKKTMKALNKMLSDVEYSSADVRKATKLYTNSKGQVAEKKLSSTGDFNVYDDVAKTKNPRKTAENYMAYCFENNYLPLFFQFAENNNYYKMIFDFNMYDCVTEKYAPQGAVKNIYPGLDLTKGESDYTELLGLIDGYLNERNEFYKEQSPKFNDVITEIKSNILTDLNQKEEADTKWSLSDKAADLDELYMSAVNSGNMEEAQRLVDEAAKSAGFKPAHRYHGTMNANFTVFDKAYAKTGGNSGAGFYFSTEEDDSANHYADVEGADNYFKWSELAEAIWDTGELPNGEDIGDEINSYEEAVQYAKDYLNKSPGTFDVYLSYKNPYIRDYGKSTDLFEYIINDFDDSIIDRNDYDSEADYEDDLLQYKDEYFFDTINKAVYEAYDQIEGFYDYVDLPNAYDLASAIAGNYDYNLNWETIENEIYNKSEATLARDEWDGSGDGTRELTRAIIEALGFDAVEDKEVSSKFGQLSREMMTDTEHVIVFKPEQIKLSDPVTYAEDGSVIPLSERFNPDNDDIRYSLPTTDADGTVLSDGQMEYFKNSQARDEQGRLVPVYHTTDKGGFTIFDPMRSNDHRSLFFSSSLDVSSTYSDKGYGNVTYHEPDEIENAEEFPFIYDDVINAGYYKVYLNLENPLVIEGKGQYWDAISLDSKLPKDCRIELYTSESLLDMAKDEDYLYKIKQARESGSKTRRLGNQAKKNGEVVLKFENGERIFAKENQDAIGKAINTHYGIEENDPTGVILAEDFLDSIQKSGRTSFQRRSEAQMKKLTSETHNTREWAEIAQMRGHDGVIFRDIIDIGGDFYLDEEEMVSDVYVAFSSNQVKDVDNLNPTENPDIRYSIPTDNEIKDSVMQRAENIEDIPLADPALEENRVRYSITVDEFRKRYVGSWNERERTFGLRLDEKSVEKHIIALMRHVMAESNTGKQYRTDTLEDTMNYAKIMWYEMKAYKTDAFAKTAWQAAEKIVDDIDYNDDLYVEYKGVRDYLKKRKIQIPEELMYDDSFADFMRDNAGRMRFDTQGSSVEAVYKYLRKKYPTLFTEDLDHPVDMLLQIDYALTLTEPYREAYTSEEYTDLVDSVATSLIDIVSEGEAYVSVADELTEKYEAKVKAMKVRHQEALQKVREERNDVIKAEKERANMWKERYNERIQKEKRDRAERRDKADHKKKFAKIEKKYKDLCKWVLEPTKDKNVPEEFRRSLAEFLQTLDLQTENSKALEAQTGHVAMKTFKMRELKDRLNALATSKTDADGNYTPSLFEVDANVAFILDKLSDKLEKNGNTIDALDLNDIDSIDVFMTLLIRNINRYKEVKMETKNAELSDVRDRSMDFFEEKIKRDGMATKRGGPLGALDTINATSLTPAYLFDRMGPLKEMYDVLRHNGFDTYIRNEAMIIDKITAILRPYYKGGKKPRPGSVIEDWRNDKEAQTFKLTHGTVTLSVAQMMSIRCLAKRGTQATDHMTCGGIYVTPIQLGSKVQAAKEKYIKGQTETPERLVLTPEDIDTIVSKLTKEQAQVADALQQLMSEDMARLGNEAHRELYGYNNFNDPNYFPIKVHGNELSTDINNIGQVVEKIKSYGPAKPVTPGAKNALVIDDIFSVVADHCNGMNLYNAYLVPITDFMKVLNSSRTKEDGTHQTMKDLIEQAYGKDVLKYIMNLVKDINGIKSDNRGGLEGIMNKALGTAKRTAVFGNVRVALQQPTAIVRALAEMDAKYFTPLINVAPEKGIKEEMYKYCPIAQWKSWGYYDTYMGRDIEDVMMNNWSRMDVALSGIYGELDNWTWSLIWRAVKAEMKDKHPEMDTKSEEFLQLCGRRASDVFDKTQVVDSTFHRSDAMRSDQVAVKLFTAFMSEPTLTLNVFRAGLYNASEEAKAGHKGKAMKIFNRAVSVIVLQAAVVSAAQAFADAWRGKDPGWPWDDDDDDEEKAGYWLRWLHNYVYNLFDQLHLENNMYLIKDVTPYINYMISQAADYWEWDPTLRAVMGWDQDYLYSQNNLVFAGLENTANGVAQLFKKLEKGDEYVDYKTKEPKAWYDIIQKILSGIGTFTGFPAGTLLRDFRPIIMKLFPAVFAADSELAENITSRFGKGIGKLTDSSEDEDDGAVLGTKAANDRKTLEKLDKKAKEKTEGLSDDEKDAVLWDVLSDGYTKRVQEGDYEYIDQLRTLYVENGGDADAFDAKILAASKTALKKSISYDQTLDDQWVQDSIKAYLTNHGLSDAEISDIAYRSDVARDLKVAMRLGDEELVKESLQPLVAAGLTREDFDRLWENRNRMKLDSYKVSGRYKDKLKSTGDFIWPTQGTITSHFGYRDAPTAGASSNHPAIDIGAAEGTDVVAADGGTVIYAGWNSGYGNSVGIQHDNGMVTYYNHLSSYNVNVGDSVSQGQLIAAVGSTGISTGPHLDFKILDKDGNPVDPEQYLS